MSRQINIDPEVEQALANRAIEEGLGVFSADTPNKILRVILGLDDVPTPVALPRPADQDGTMSPDVRDNVESPTPTNNAHQRIGSRLLREHGLGYKKGYFSKNGVPYQKPDTFPAVLFDPCGYLIIEDEDSILRNSNINVGKQLSIPRGIRSIPGYVQCPHTHGLMSIPGQPLSETVINDRR
jgi:hypothetical protein